MKSQDSQEAIVDLNIAPLVDVVLVLLIIFMATAPLIQQRSINVNVPKVATSEPKATQTLTITIDKEGKVFLSDAPLSLQDLSMQVKAMVKADPYLHVSVQGDQDISYGIVAQVLDVVRASGVKKLGLEVGRKAADPTLQ